MDLLLATDERQEFRGGNGGQNHASLEQARQYGFVCELAAILSSTTSLTVALNCVVKVYIVESWAMSVPASAVSVMDKLQRVIHQKCIFIHMIVSRKIIYHYSLSPMSLFLQENNLFLIKCYPTLGYLFGLSHLD